MSVLDAHRSQCEEEQLQVDEDFTDLHLSCEGEPGRTSHRRLKQNTQFK